MKTVNKHHIIDNNIRENKENKTRQINNTVITTNKTTTSTWNKQNNNIRKYKQHPENKNNPKGFCSF